MIFSIMQCWWCSQFKTRTCLSFKIIRTQWHILFFAAFVNILFCFLFCIAKYCFIRPTNPFARAMLHYGFMALLPLPKFHFWKLHKLESFRAFHLLYIPQYAQCRQMYNLETWQRSPEWVCVCVCVFVSVQIVLVPTQRLPKMNQPHTDITETRRKKIVRAKLLLIFIL